ncbi:MAG: hypothetical protein JSW52_02935 [Candidatus Coatesbacteria bacterium]|nr:MAG: hypothetical protein JSW52_02935 [Candidatus Coatesbacteria bacterium]
MRKTVALITILLLTLLLPFCNPATAETGISIGDLIAYESGKPADDGDNEYTETTEPEESEITEKPYVTKKDPLTSFLLSLLVPGGGQFYNGETLKGFIMLTGFAVGVGVGVELDSNGRHGSAAAVLSMTAGVWAYSMADAVLSSQRINAEHGFSFAPMDDGIAVTYSYSF